MNSIRESEEYKKLDSFTACGTIEGFTNDNPTELEVLASWQYLVDTGVCWSLQGFYGRGARSLINRGLIESAPDKVSKDAGVGVYTKAQVLAGAGYQDGGEPYTPEELALINHESGGD